MNEGSNGWGELYGIYITKKKVFVHIAGISCTYSKGIVVTWCRNLIKREQAEELGKR